MPRTADHAQEIQLLSRSTPDVDDDDRVFLNSSGMSSGEEASQRFLTKFWASTEMPSRPA